MENSELIFWNIETNKCFIISDNGCGSDGSLGEQQSEVTENDLPKNIDEMRKILETDPREINDDVEEQMRKMFDENNADAIADDIVVFEEIDRNQSKQSDFDTEDESMGNKFTNSQLEASQYEHTNEIASEQQVENYRTALSVCCSEDKKCNIVLTNKNYENNLQKVSTMLEHFQEENLKNVIAESINEKRQRLQEIRIRISKIHIHLNEKRKYYELARTKFMDEPKKSTSGNAKSIRVMKSIILNRSNLKKNRKRNCPLPKKISQCRSKFKKEFRNNFPKKSLQIKKVFNKYTKPSPVKPKMITNKNPKNYFNDYNKYNNENLIKETLKRKYCLKESISITRKEELKQPQELFEHVYEPMQQISDSLEAQNVSKISTNAAAESRENGTQKLIRFDDEVKRKNPMRNKISQTANDRAKMNDELYSQIRRIIRSKNEISDTEKVYNHFLERIDADTYHQSKSFNMDSINYTLRWLQYILSRKLHKTDMEIELEKLKVHYYRLFQLMLIRCCGSDTKYRKHCECSNRLNRVVFCTLMDTYVLRIVKYIIWAFQNNYENVLNSTETIAGFLSFFIDRSKLLYFLYRHKSQFLYRAPLILKENAKPKSLNLIARMSMLKAICKNPKMHECMEDTRQPIQMSQLIKTIDIASDYEADNKMPNTIPNQLTTKSFNSDYSIEKLLQKTVEMPAIMEIHKKESCKFNSKQQKNQKQMSASERIEPKFHSQIAEKETIPDGIGANNITSMEKTFVAVGDISYELATMPDFVRGACQVISERYPHITINPSVAENKRFSKQLRMSQSRRSVTKKKNSPFDDNRMNHWNEFSADDHEQVYSKSTKWECSNTRNHSGKYCTNEKIEKYDKKNQIKYPRQLFHGNKHQYQTRLPIPFLRVSDSPNIERIDLSSSSSLQEPFVNNKIKIISSIVLKPTEKSDQPNTIETILISDDSDVENLKITDNLIIKNCETPSDVPDEPRNIEYSCLADNDNAADKDRRRNEVLYEERRYYKFAQNYLSKHKFAIHKKENALNSNEDSQSKKSILLGKYKESDMVS